MSLSSGKLWVVATPLGNYDDLSPRARAVLQQADMILAEDTRRTGRLLAECNIPAPPMTSYNDFNEKNKLQHILALLSDGKQVALVSDAGTPVLSDPGYMLIRQCRENDITVSPVPGPSAVISALSASGIAPLPFTFLGFPPRKDGEIARFFSPYAQLPTTLIFFERKDRLPATLDIAYTQLGERTGCIARELTKPFEEFIPFVLSRHAHVSQNLLGELTVVLGPPDKPIKLSEQAIHAILQEEQRQGGKPKEIAKRAAERAQGWTAKEIYELLRHRQGNQDSEK